MITEIQAVREFEKDLTAVLAKIAERARSQFDYNLKTNIPKQIAGITFDNAAEQAIELGIVAGSNQYSGWDCRRAIERAQNIMSDANCHTEAKALNKFLK